MTTVKSQTSRALATLRRLLGITTPAEDVARTDDITTPVDPQPVDHAPARTGSER